jgi:hypothetical protein
MADSLTIAIIVFLALNIIGLLFFGGKIDSQISNFGKLSSSSSNSSYNSNSSISPVYNNVNTSLNGYSMNGVNTTSVYDSISPTLQQVKSNIITKLDQQKQKIKNHEQQIEEKRQILLNKQQQIQNEINNLDEKLVTSLSDEQLAQINLIKSNLKTKMNNIQSQLHGVDANKAQCVVPQYDFSNRQIRFNKGKRPMLFDRSQFQNDWSSDWTLDNEVIDESIIVPEEVDIVESPINTKECFTSFNPYLSVFNDKSGSTFAPYDS